MRGGLPGSAAPLRECAHQCAPREQAATRLGHRDHVEDLVPVEGEIGGVGALPIETGLGGLSLVLAHRDHHAGQLPLGAVPRERCAAGIAVRGLGLVGRAALVELTAEHLGVEHARRKVLDEIGPPAQALSDAPLVAVDGSGGPRAGIPRGRRSAVAAVADQDQRSRVRRGGGGDRERRERGLRRDREHLEIGVGPVGVLEPHAAAGDEAVGDPAQHDVAGRDVVGGDHPAGLEIDGGEAAAEAHVTPSRIRRGRRRVFRAVARVDDDRGSGGGEAEREDDRRQSAHDDDDGRAAYHGGSRRE